MPTTRRNYWLHIQDKNHHESQLSNRFLHLTGSNFGLDTWLTGDIAPANDISAICARRNNINRP
jgi:hypothetical protein